MDVNYLNCMYLFKHKCSRFNLIENIFKFNIGDQFKWIDNLNVCVCVCLCMCVSI